MTVWRKEIYIVCLFISETINGGGDGTAIKTHAFGVRDLV